MRHFLLIGFLLFFGFHYVSAQQTFDWVSGMGGTDSDYGLSVASDNDGNVFTTGFFYQDGDFDPGTNAATLTSPAQQDLFVSKLDANGDYVWAYRFGNIERNRGNDIIVDENGDVYITGYFEGTVDFNPGTGTEELTSMGIVDMFVLKLDNDGNFLWVKHLGGSGAEEGQALTINKNGDVLASGYFTSDMDFGIGGTSQVVTSAGARDAFAVSLSAIDGTLNWYRQFQGAGDAFTADIEVDRDENIFVTGFFDNTIDFNPSQGSLTLSSNSGSRDIFVVKISDDGNYFWAKRAGGAGDDRGEGLAITPLGNIFIGGQFEQTVDFDPSGGVDELTTGGLIDGYLWSIDNNGMHRFVNQITSGTNNIIYDLDIDPLGNVYATGYFTGTASFDGTNQLTTMGGNDLFTAKYDENGNVSWLENAGSSGNDFSLGIDVFNGWNIYTTGYFNGTCDFDPNNSNTSLTSADALDIFVSRWSQTCTAPVLDSINYTAADTLFCPSEMASTQLVAIGDLNDAADWEWYTEGCGMTHVASGDTVTFMPTETTTYYVRAEGACGTPQSCDSITIHIDDFEAPVADVATLDDITAICEVTELSAPTATDNCEGTLQGTHGATLPITSNTTITWTYEDASGNVATQTQDVVLTGVDVSTTVNGIQLIANNDNVGVDYRWIDCNNNNEPIVDATNQSYTPEENGSYAVIVLEEGCQDTSDCIEVTMVGLEDYAKTDVKVYPNPSKGAFTVELPAIDLVSYTVTDNAGRIIHEGDFDQLENTVDLSTEEHGVYFLRVEEHVVRLVVQ